MSAIAFFRHIALTSKALRLNSLFLSKKSIFVSKFNRISLNIKPYRRNFIATSSIIGTLGFGSFYYFNNQKIVKAYSYSHYPQVQHSKPDSCGENCDHDHLLEKIHDLGPKINAKQMLSKFLEKLSQSNTEGHILDLKFVSSIFSEVGIEDEDVCESIFNVMDWNKSGTLEPEEIAGILTLFETGDYMERFEFLFRCLDLDGNKKIDRSELRKVLTSLYEAGYHLSGLHDNDLSETAFIDMSEEDYHTIAKLKSNILVSKVFDYADLNRDGVLDHKEFMRWASRGGKDVKILSSLLRQTLGDVPDTIIPYVMNPLKITPAMH